MAKRAVFKLEVEKFAFESLVLAGLASVVLLREDALAASDARREVAATLSAVDIILCNARLAVFLGAIEFFFLLVDGRMSRE